MIVDLPYTPMTISTGCTTRNLDPLIVDLPFTHMTISTGCQSVHFNHKMQKYCPQNLTHLNYVKLNGFHDNL